MIELVLCNVVITSAPFVCLHLDLFIIVICRVLSDSGPMGKGRGRSRPVEKEF